MRSSGISIVCVVLAGAGSCIAAEAGEPTPGPARDAVMAYYPPAALVAGKGGQAILNCSYTKHAALRFCSVDSEDPARLGFGKAALKLAKLTRDNPEVSMPRATGPSYVKFTFRPEPPSITPNPFEPMHLVIEPLVVSVPSPGERAHAYPKTAGGRSGRVLIKCMVTKSGSFDNCVVAEENPPRLGFGEAALRESRLIRLRPQTIDGKPS